ncbi:MAG: flagellar basal body P-ring protein FlgI, partial [Alphaproteobacteria bacterium]|nr:flagellar basal body P-ring protein FlgI [Alphaproteobacteria bacterium]
MPAFLTRCLFSPLAPLLAVKWSRARQFSFLAAVGLALLILNPFQDARASSRLKDVVDFEGVRDNMLVGYGLVVGLNGSGDSLTNSPFTETSLVGMLERLGINTRGTSMKTKNVAAVMVTSTLPAFTSQGSDRKSTR